MSNSALSNQAPRSEVIDAVIDIFSGYSGTSPERKPKKSSRSGVSPKNISNTVNEQQADVTASVQNMRRLQEDNARLREAVGTISNKLQRTLEVLQNKGIERNDSSGLANTALQARLERRDNQIRRLEDEISRLRIDLHAAQDDIAHQVGRNSELRDELNLLRSNEGMVNDEAMNDALHDLNIARLDAERFSRMAGDYKQELLRLQEIHSNMSSENESLRQQCESLTERVSALEASTDEARRAAAAEHERARLLQRRVEQYELSAVEFTEGAAASVAAAESRCAALQEELAQLRQVADTRIDTLQSRIAHLQADKDRLMSSLTSRAITSPVLSSSSAFQGSPAWASAVSSASNKILHDSTYLGEVPPPGTLGNQYWLGGRHFSAGSQALAGALPGPVLESGTNHGINGVADGAITELPQVSDAAMKELSEWVDAPDWVPRAAVEAAIEFRARFCVPSSTSSNSNSTDYQPSVIPPEAMNAFLLASNRAWFQRARQMAREAARAVARKAQWQEPYKEVLQAATISRLRGSLSALNARLVSSSNTPNYMLSREQLAAAKKGLTTSASTNQGLNFTMDLVQSRKSPAFGRSQSGQSTETFGRLLSVPGSGSRRYDHAETLALLSEALECVEHLQSKVNALEQKDGSRHSNQSLNGGNEEDDDLDDYRELDELVYSSAAQRHPQTQSQVQSHPPLQPQSVMPRSFNIPNIGRTGLKREPIKATATVLSPQNHSNIVSNNTMENDKSNSGIHHLPPAPGDSATNLKRRGSIKDAVFNATSEAVVTAAATPTRSVIS